MTKTHLERKLQLIRQNTVDQYPLTAKCVLGHAWLPSDQQPAIKFSHEKGLFTYNPTHVAHFTVEHLSWLTAQAVMMQ